MKDEATCGKGLAAHAAMHQKVAGLIAAVAENLELHQNTLDLEDDNSRQELKAYVALAVQHRMIAAQLEATGKQMLSCEHLPMGRHDERSLGDPRLAAALQLLVNAEQSLLEYLTASVAQHRAMLPQT